MKKNYVTGSSVTVDEVTEGPVVAKRQDETAIAAVVIPAAVGVVIGVLFLVGFFVARKKRATAVDLQQPYKEDAETKRRSSSVTTETISLQHWTSKKAVSNRYESWNIGEIDQSWVKRNSPFFKTHCVNQNNNSVRLAEEYKLDRRRMGIPAPSAARHQHFRRRLFRTSLEMSSPKYRQ